MHSSLDRMLPMKCNVTACSTLVQDLPLELTDTSGVIQWTWDNASSMYVHRHISKRPGVHGPSYHLNRLSLLK